jgi:hypothetical protein
LSKYLNIVDEELCGHLECPAGCHPLSGVIPAKAGIQYPAASPGLLDRPLSRAMTPVFDFRSGNQP